ncbi:MAG: TonB-dependent receptor [Cyclobacteriaceae bacterium]|nr:TonB-dependent receptor [Cyclobacteriaceae bacterium]
MIRFCWPRVIFTLCLSCLFCGGSIAQDWNAVPKIVVGDSASLTKGSRVLITGNITSTDGSAVAGASISAELFKHFDYADAHGRYILEVPPGRYRVTVRSLGMKPYYFWLIALSDGLVNITLEEGAMELSEIVISSRALDSNIKQALSGLTKLNVQEIRTLPTMTGEVDIVRTLQLMPGVSSVGEGSSGFNVRGGRTDQNLVLLNDVPLFNTSHALGFVSAFNQDVIRDFTLYKGAVPAQYGGRASSALEITTRRGNTEEWQYQGGVGLITSRFTAEGPLVKSSTSLLVAGRISHAGWFLKSVNDPDVRNSKAFFYDGFASVSHRFSERSSAEITWYTSRDDFGFSDQFKYAWDNHIVNASWKGLADRKASPSVSLSFGQYKSKLIDPSPPDARELTNTLNYLKLKSAVSYVHEERHNATAGFELIGYFPKPENQQPYGDVGARRKTVDRSQGAEAALFINDDFKISENVALNVGLRYSQYAQLGPDTVFSYRVDAPRSTSTITDTTLYSGRSPIKWFGGLEPRVALRINVSASQSIKLAYNRMYQYVHQVSNTTAPTPVDLWHVSNEYMPPQMADSYSIGYFANLSDNVLETSVEVFYKDMRNLIEYKDFPELYLNAHPETELRPADGRAYGAELYVRKLKGRWTGWLSYSWSQTEVRVTSPFPSETVNGGEWYPSHYNRPHNFNLVLNRSLRGRGAFSLIFSYYSGRPLTAIEDTYIVDDVVVPVYSERNKYTIPHYMRLDFSFTIGSIFRKIDDSLVFSVYNLLGRDNAYSVFYKRPVPSFFIPVAYRLAVLGSPMPSLTYNFKF